VIPIPSAENRFAGGQTKASHIPEALLSARPWKGRDTTAPPTSFSRSGLCFEWKIEGRTEAIAQKAGSAASNEIVSRPNAKAAHPRRIQAIYGCKIRR